MAIVQNPQSLDLSDIQGMITRGYAKLPQTAYYLLHVNDGDKTKEWLKEIMPLIDSADHKKQTSRTLHLAFGYDGLKHIGLHEENLKSFPVPFREGMSTPNRNRILGDYGDAAPEKWQWGSTNDEQIVLVFHAATKDDLTAFIEEQKQLMSKIGGVSVKHELTSYLPADNKEPFGFHDGISQPVIKGSGKSGPDNDMIETGEFLLGYKNEHGHFPDSPSLNKVQGDVNSLTDSPSDQGKKDLGKNGTFMVFRQMEQHVDKFWNAMEEHTKKSDGSIDPDAKIRLASKCIGRWPSGAALVNYPDGDPGGSHQNDDFGYADNDSEGLRCPYGSHLRRNNPRDSVRDYNKKQSLKISRRHRIIRRGRTYETPSTNGEKAKIGLQFICFNTNLELQFEFIQHAWSNDNQTDKFSNDIDIVIGVPNEGDPNQKNGQFTVQNQPVNEYYTGWDRFVTVKGGAYLFFPSISVLNYLTTI